MGDASNERPTTTSVCKEHARHPEHIYHKCIGCGLRMYKHEVQKLKHRIAELEGNNIGVVYDPKKPDPSTEV